MPDLSKPSDPITIPSIADSLSATERLFSKLLILLKPLNQIDSEVLDPWTTTSERISMLPIGSQAAIKKTQNYKLAANYVLQTQRVSDLRDAQLDLLSETADPSEVNSILGELSNLKVSPTQISTFKKSLIALNKSIPPHICQKGTVTVRTSKSGRCAKGFELIPTS